MLHYEPVWDQRKGYVIDQVVRHGRNVSEIAKEFGVSAPRMTAVLQGWGLSARELKRMRHAGWATPTNLRKLVQEDGFRPSQIAELYKVSDDLVNSFLKEFDIDWHDPMTRFMAKTKPGENGCILWTANNYKGYGRFTVNGEDVWAHRWIYEQKHGPIPKGMTIDHLCVNPPCVNDEHMEVVTQSENTSRMHKRLIDAGVRYKTHCKYGHEYTYDNTYYYEKDGRKLRQCRICIKDRWNKSYIPSRNRGEDGRVTSCKNGHPYTDDNKLINKYGIKVCKACRGNYKKFRKFM